MHRTLFKKLKFYYTNKWYMYKRASIRENETHKLLRDFDIQTDHLISAKSPDQEIIKKKKRENLSNSELCCPSEPQSKKSKKAKRETST